MPPGEPTNITLSSHCRCGQFRDARYSLAIWLVRPEWHHCLGKGRQIVACKKYSIFCSPGHFISFTNLNKKEEIKLKKFLFKHQIKKKFQYSLEWEKNQLAIWDNRSMLHQATPFKGNRIMHRITIQ